MLIAKLLPGNYFSFSFNKTLWSLNTDLHRVYSQPKINIHEMETCPLKNKLNLTILKHFHSNQYKKYDLYYFLCTCMSF